MKAEHLLAVTRAGEQHRAAGGTGPAPDSMVDEALALVRLELREESRATPEPAPVAAPSLLADGAATPKVRSMRGIDGREHLMLGRGDRMADHVNRVQDGLTIENLGNALAAMACGESHRYRDEIRSLSEGINTAGGLMVSEELSATLIDKARSQSVCFQAGVNVVPMQSDTLRLVRVVNDPTSALTGEGAEITASDGSFDSILLTAKKIACLTSATNEILQDAGNAGEAIINSMAASMARAMDDYILDKIFNSTQIGTESSVSGITYQDFLKAMNDVKVLNGVASAVLCHPDLTYDLSLITETDTDAFMAPPVQMAALTFYESTAIANTHALVGDPRTCIVGLRKNIELRMSSEAGNALSSDLTYFRALARIDANITQPHWRILAGIS